MVQEGPLPRGQWKPIHSAARRREKGDHRYSDLLTLPYFSDHSHLWSTFFRLLICELIMFLWEHTRIPATIYQLNHSLLHQTRQRDTCCAFPWLKMKTCKCSNQPAVERRLPATRMQWAITWVCWLTGSQQCRLVMLFFLLSVSTTNCGLQKAAGTDRASLTKTLRWQLLPIYCTSQGQNYKASKYLIPHLDSRCSFIKAFQALTRDVKRYCHLCVPLLKTFRRTFADPASHLIKQLTDH